MKKSLVYNIYSLPFMVLNMVYNINFVKTLRVFIESMYTRNH